MFAVFDFSPFWFGNLMSTLAIEEIADRQSTI